MHLLMNWPIAPGVTASLPVEVQGFSGSVSAQKLFVSVAPLGTDGKPIPGQNKQIAMPTEVFQAFAATQTQAMLEAIQALPPESIAAQRLPDFSQATLVTDEPTV